MISRRAKLLEPSGTPESATDQFQAGLERWKNDDRTDQGGELSEVPPGGKKLVEVDGRAVAFFNVGGTFYAIDDVCTHDGGPLAEG